MSESGTHKPDEQVDEQLANLQAQLVMLKQENHELRSRLQSYEHSQATQQLKGSDSASEHRLLAATASAANALLTNNDPDQAINSALRILGESLETDRIQILESLCDNPARPFSRYHNVLYEWIRPDTRQQQSPLQAKQIDTRNLESFFQTFVQNKGFGGLRSEWDESLQALFPGVEVKSGYAIPMRVNEQWWGILVFDDCQEAKHHTSAELATLQTAADCIGSAIVRQRMQQAREEAERQALLSEKAAQERAAELAKANEAFQRSAIELTTITNIDDILTVFLREAIAASGAAAGAVLRRVAGTEFEFVAILQDDELLRGEPLQNHPFSIAVRDWTRRDQTGYFTKVANGQTMWWKLTPDGMDWFPQATEYHRAHGHKAVWDIPFSTSSEVFGYLGLAFRTTDSPSTVVTEAITALSYQVAVALELTRLAKEAKQAAIAREQERAAYERAAELERANDALARTAVRLTKQGDLTHFFDELLLETSRQLGADSAHLVVYDNKQRRYNSLHQHNGNVKHEPELPPSFSLDEMQPENFHTIAERERCPRWYDPQADAALFSPGAGEFLSRAGLRSVLHVPLIVGEQIVGGIGFAFREPHPEGGQRQVLVEALAHQAALAIQLIQLADEAQQAAILAERNRMAGEIHDSLSQSFIGVLMQLQIADSLLDSEPNEVQDCITLAQAIAKEGLTEARLSVWSLCQENTDYCFIADTLSRIIQQLTTGTSIQAMVHTQGTPYCLQAEVGLNLLRIAQESLTNSLRYAQASVIEVHLIYASDHLQLCVRDDGRGFDPQHCRNGFGLISMRQRAEQIGAQFQLQTQPGAGAVIAVTVPICSP
ncbi:GAF domain-containing protein [Phormidium tenue FACHB-886]|nr:GAF domain-containing protein [Phormidium tenue FACHB-886]